jgi:tight adherence protein B
MALGLIVGLVFLVTVGLVVGGYFLVAGRPDAALRRTVGDRLQQLSGGPVAPVDPTDTLIRTHERGPLPVLDRVAKRATRGLAVDRWVQQSGLRLTISGLFLITMLLGVVGAIVALSFDHRWWAGAGGFVAGLAAPCLFVRSRRTARMNKFEEQFPEALDLMARAVRAGHAFGSGMKMVADEMHEPVGPEFRASFEEQNFGLSMKESLNNLALRVPLLDVRFFSTAVLIQRETGGNLAEILDNLANVVRERFKIRRQVRVHTAHGRFTGYVLLALPAFLAIALHFINPEHMEMLFKDKIGHTMIMAAIAMQTTGWFWIKRVIKIEV